MSKPTRHRSAQIEAPSALEPDAASAKRRGAPFADLALGATLALGAFALYAVTACRTIFSGDSAELAATAALFGVPHPPGYPLYTMITGLFVHALPFGEPAFGANLASGLYAALAVWLAYALARRLGARTLGAAFAASTLAVGRTFWSQSVVAEVYTLDILLLMCMLHAAVSLARTLGWRAALLTGGVMGLWIGHRTVNVIYVLPLAIWAAAAIDLGPLLARRRTLFTGLGLIGLGGMASLAVYAYLPLASSLDPALDIGDPESFARMKVVVAATPYMRHLGGGTPELDAGRLWRFLLSLPITVGLAAPLAVAGWLSILRRSTWTAIALGLALVANLAFACRYNILDIEVYFLVTTTVVALLAAPGLDALLDLVTARATALRPITGALGLAGVIGLCIVNLPHNDVSEHAFARHLGEDLLESAAPDGLLFVDGDTSIHSLWYLQAVEGIAPGVVVVSLGHIWPWYHEQLVARYPDEPWPEVAPGTKELQRSQHARAILERLGQARPVYFTLSVAPPELLGPAAGQPGRTALKGIAREVRAPGDELDEGARLERARENAVFLQAALERMGPVPAQLDIDTHSTLLEYALALTVTAEELAVLGAPDLAREAAAAVLSLRPDWLEYAVRLDVRQGLGQTIPAFKLEARARAAAAEGGPGQAAPR
jgi:hypothetical protein